MKKLLSLSLVGILLTGILSCMKESGYTTRYDQMLSKNAGTLFAKVNSIPWPFVQRVLVFTGTDDTSSNTFSLDTQVFGEDKLKYQSFRIGGISRMIKTDTLITATNLFRIPTYSPDKYLHPHAIFELGGEDYTETTYDLLRDSSNGVTVTSYDSGAKQIQGNFHFTLIRTQGKSTQGMPNTLCFTDGVFRTHFINTFSIKS